MEVILYFFRDSISGIYYVMYAFVCLFLMFSIIGYLFKQKYAKVELKLNSSQGQPIFEKKNKKEVNKQEKSKQVGLKTNIIQNNTQPVNTPISNQNTQVQKTIQENPKIQAQPVVNQSIPVTQKNVVQTTNNQNTTQINSQVVNKTIPEIKK